MSLGVFVRKDYSVAAAGGFMIQLMPDCPEDMIEFLEKKVSEIKSVTSMMLEGYNEMDMAKEIFEHFEFHVVKKIDVQYKCNCSEDKIYKVLLALGRKELEDIRSQKEDIELRCHFCNTAYKISKDKIDQMLREMNGSR